jgi:hypothetical protein
VLISCKKTLRANFSRVTRPPILLAFDIHGSGESWPEGSVLTERYTARHCTFWLDRPACGLYLQCFVLYCRRVVDSQQTGRHTACLIYSLPVPLRSYAPLIIYIYIYIYIYDMWYLTAIGLTPGDSSTVHIHTQTVHRIQRTEHT